MNPLNPIRILPFTVALFLHGCASSAPPMQDGVLDCEGLTRLAGTGLGGICIQESITGSYREAMLDEIEYGFRPVGTSSSSSYVGREAGTRYPVGPQQKTELKSLAVEAFDTALGDLGLARSSAAGAGVLRVRGQILDVLLEVPEDPDSGAKYLFDRIGRATIVVELYDSEAKAVLLRAFDHRETAPLSADADAAPSQMAAIAGLWQAVLTESMRQLLN
jgi:hypothetical protein